MAATSSPRARRRVLLALLAVLACLGVGFALARPGAKAAATNPDELEFFTRLNDLRTSRGLPALAWSDPLASDARIWSTRMVQTNTLAHDPNFAAEIAAAVPDWQRGGENVGRGGDVLTTHNAFVASPGHLANMIGDYHRVGIGTVRTAGGLYVTVRFAKARSGIGAGSNPFGSYDSLAWTGPATLTASGWAIDPDTANPINVLPVIDGIWRNVVTANGSRPDVGAAYPAFGANHGFTVPLGYITPGPHEVCLHGVNVGAGSATKLGCRTAIVPADPFGVLDSVTVGTKSVTARGWEIDPDTVDPVSVLVTLDGVWQTPLPLANASRPDVAAVHPAYGPNHGYALTYPVSSGSRQVCVWSINVGPGANGLIGCRVVTVP